MKTLKSSTSQGKRVVRMAYNCKSERLDELYKTYSSEKANAYDRCRELCAKENGFIFRIGNANTFGFTASWFVKGERFNELRVETKNNSYRVIVD